MKEKLRGYYSPSIEEFENLWNDANFVIDANVLLNLYRYTPKTSENLIKIFTKFSDRIWIPYQVALEYQRNRLSVISKQNKAYQEIIDLLEKTENRFDADLGAYNYHPFIDVKQIQKKAAGLFTNIKKDLKSYEVNHPKLIKDDKIRDQITKLFSGHVGSKIPSEEMIALFKDGKIRYEKKIPPGFEDAENKDDDRKYGDLILWQEILNYAKKTKKPIIFITDDVKDDWWWKFNGEIQGPRPELIEEITQIAKVNFYMYRSDQFLKHAQKHLKQQISSQSIKEITEIQKQDAKIKKNRRTLDQELDNFSILKQKLIYQYKELTTKITEGRIRLSNIEPSLIQYSENENNLNDKELADFYRLQGEFGSLSSDIENLEEQNSIIRSQLESLEEIEKDNVTVDQKIKSYRFY